MNVTTLKKAILAPGIRATDVGLTHVPSCSRSHQAPMNRLTLFNLGEFW